MCFLRTLSTSLNRVIQHTISLDLETGKMLYTVFILIMGVYDQNQGVERLGAFDKTNC